MKLSQETISIVFYPQLHLIKELFLPKECHEYSKYNLQLN